MARDQIYPFFVSKLARCTNSPGKTHLGALDRVLRYLKGTVSLAIHYGCFPAVLEGYSDASWIAKNSGSNGCLGYVFTLAQLYALDTTGTEAEWLYGLLPQLPIAQVQGLVLFDLMILTLDNLGSGSNQKSPLAEYVEKNLHSPSYAGKSDANKSPPSSPRSVSSYSVTPIMVTNATTIEEQLVSLTRVIEGLTKHVQEQDTQIARLINKADNVDASHVMGKQVEAHDELKEFIEGTIRSKIEGSSKSSLSYSKPYTPMIDSLKMLMGYQPPKFQQVDGKGNPKQHVAHFVETCNNAGTYGDHLVKQFVRLLKGNAFNWYTDLEAGSIDRWEQLEQEFLNRFYRTRRTVSVPLPSRCVFKECIGDFAISSKESCLDPLKNWSLEHINIELSMIASGVEGPPVQELRRKKEKQEMKKWGKPFSKAPSKESMAVNVAPLKLKSTAKDNIAPRNNGPYERPQRKLTLKEMQAREYLFLDFDVPGIFDELLEANLIDLPEIKRPEESK
ncbi:UNVERIFIED_CONTAM: hypothetical protein Scaly_2766800 [Sesamum calycinum]|uniref:Retrotransposon gag domain-containing protein n=1 Tax=Sesamum calycinum TaxID=2727403 RepID=A0AAW2IYX7_9LAMI